MWVAWAVGPGWVSRGVWCGVREGEGQEGVYGQQIRLKAYKLMRTTMGGAGAAAYRAELVPDFLSLGDKKK